MKILWTLPELLLFRSNGWTCECGAVWLDVALGVAHKVAEGDPEHRHRRLTRAMIHG